MAEEFHVEQAHSSDWIAICETFRAAGRAAWQEIFTSESLGHLDPPERWRGAIGHSGSSGEVWVAREVGRPVGFIVLRQSQDEDATPTTGEIDSFYTHPSVWGRGFGRALMALAVRRLSELDFESATLWTERRNLRPRRFYEEAGWTLDGKMRQRSILDSFLIEDRYRRVLQDGKGPIEAPCPATS